MQREQAQQLVQRMADGWMRADVAAIVALFAPDGLFISPGGVAYGHAAIAAAATAFFREVERVSVYISRVIVDGNYGAVEWVWQETARGSSEPRRMEDAIVFQERDGSIVYWREYFDPRQIEPFELPTRHA